MFLAVLSLRNLQGLQELCARSWGQRPISTLYIISQQQMPGTLLVLEDGKGNLVMLLGSLPPREERQAIEKYVE